MSGWKTVRISEFCRTGTGGTPSRSNLERYYEGGTIPWVKSGELRETVINETEEHVTEAALRETNMKLVPAGALLLAMYGATVGRLGILGVEATTNQAVCHIVPDPKAAEVRFLFHALSKAELRQIIDIQLRGLVKRLEDRKIRVELSEKAKDLIIAEAYDPTYGARPLKRTIQRRILDPLAVRVLQGDFREGDTVLIDVKAGSLVFDKAETGVAA